MSLKMKKIILTWILSVFLVFYVVAGAYAYSSILSFGDSISDNGVYGLYSDPAHGVYSYSDPAAAYTSSSDSYGYQRFSNGPVWVEDLAQHYGLTLLDMAYGGARTTATYPNLGWQIANYTGPVSSTILVTVLAGANDMSAFLASGGTNPTYSPQNAAARVFVDIQTLANEGFTDFFLPNLPNIGATVRFSNPPYLPLKGAASQWCWDFNGYLATGLTALETEFPSADFMTFDTYGLMTDMYDHPAAYGFSSVNDIFWTDGYHPSAQTHQLMAKYAEQTIPEPATMLLLGLGLIGLAGVRRKIKK